MKKDKFRNKKWYNNAVAIVIGVVSYVALTNLDVINGFLRNVGGYFMPIFYGGVIAYLVNPLASSLQKRVFKHVRSETLKWTLSVFVGMFMVILFLSALLFMLVPQLIESILLLVSNMDNYIARLNLLIQSLNIGALDIGSQLESMMGSPEDLLRTASQFLSTSESMMGSPEDLLRTASQFLSTSLRRILSTSANIGRTIFNLLIASILSIYLLLAKDSIKSGSKRLMRSLMSQKWYDIVMNFMSRCNNILVRYIVFSLLDGVIVGGATAVFMAICGMQYVGLVSVVCGVTNLIPSFGPVIGAVIGGFILLLVNPWHALMFLGFTAILQTLDGYVIKPKLFGDSLGVSGLLILVSIVLFGNIFGVVGILLAIPLAAIIDFTYEEGILPLLEMRRAEKDAELIEEGPDEKESKEKLAAMEVLSEMSEGGKHK